MDQVEIVGPGASWCAVSRRATAEKPDVAKLVSRIPGAVHEVVLRLLRGESMEALSRELGIELHRLARWRDRAVSGMDEALRERDGDPLQGELDAAIRRVGELSMENELLRGRIRAAGPLGSGRSRR